MSDMRETSYAKELVPPAVVTFPNGEEARLERLKIRETGNVEIRLSWWKDGRLMPRPLDLPEADLIKLLAISFRQGVLLPGECGCSADMSEERLIVAAACPLHSKYEGRLIGEHPCTEQLCARFLESHLMAM